MSGAQSEPYNLQFALGVAEQIRAIRAESIGSGDLSEFLDVLREAVRRLRTDPLANRACDPEADAVVSCRWLDADA